MSATSEPFGTQERRGASEPIRTSEPFTFDLGSRPAGGVGLCLSGGGDRAMVFHLGALRRLNEAGWLPRLTPRALAATPARLVAMPRETRLQLANWGYAVADAGLRSWVTPSLPEPPGFPWSGGLG